MKKLLTASVLAMGLATPAYADFVQLTAEDGDELEMFIVKADAKDSLTIGGTLDKNNGPTVIDITSPTLVTSGNGNANIKPATKGSLTSIEFDPVAGETLDGFFTGVQLEYDGPLKGNNVPSVGTFYIDVNGGGNAGGQTFSFTQALNSNNMVGFDESGLPGTESLITSVVLRTASIGIFSFKEIKQVDWSPCSDVGSICLGTGTTGSPVPETSTWAMMLGGFGLMGLLGWRKHKTARFAI